VSTARDLPAYVLTSAINLTRDSLRRRGAAKRSAPGATTGDGAMLSPWAPTPEREAIGREELRHHLAECRRLLSDRQYRIFRLVYLGGYTSREVAERVGLRTSSVDSALHRMRRAVGGRVVPIRQQAARRRLS
jgi:RNA polymerase sigma factor (sigma-70 family)